MKKAIVVITYLLSTFLSANCQPADILNTAKETIRQSDSFWQRNISFDWDAKGFILSSLTNTSIDPFYHGSALLDGTITTRIGGHVSIPLRTVAEVWNFSNDYGSDKNMFFWAKPALVVNLPIANPVVNSFNLTAGDLRRVRHGQGLSLDYFESQGASFDLKLFKRFDVGLTTIGWGWTGADDIYLYRLTYDSLVSVRLLDDFTGEHSRIVSGDISLKKWNHFKLYGEGGYNIDKHANGLLLGIDAFYQHRRNFISLGLEYRHYDRDFLKFSNIDRYPYFNSLTAIDKPVNNFRFYQPEQRAIDVIAARLTMHYYLYRQFFYMADVEYIGGSLSACAYETAIGYEPARQVRLKLGLLNKFFNLSGTSNESSGMFTLSDNIWIMIKADFAVHK